MPSLRSALLLFLIGAAAPASGCAAEPGAEPDATLESDVEVAPKLVVASSRVTAAAVVDADRLSVPTEVAHELRALDRGVIVVGARGPSGSKNPDGFLRRVETTRVDGAMLVVTTSPATLTEAIVSGSVRASSSGGRIDAPGEDALRSGKDLGAIAIDFSDQPLFENVDTVDGEAGPVSFTETVRFERAVLSARPSVDVDLAIDGGQVRRFVAKVEGNLDSSILARATVSADAPPDAAALAALKAKRHEITRVLFKSKRVALPTFAVGRVPVSPSVELSVSMKCSIAFGGPLAATAGVEAKSYVRMGGVFAQGEWQAPIRSEFDIRPAFALEQGGEVDARCAIEADAELFAYGVSGVKMTVAPYVDFEVERGVRPDVGPAPHLWRAAAGATGSMKGSSGVFGLRDLDRPLVAWSAEPLTGRLP